MENFRVCRRCLTRDMMDKAAYFQNMYDYINNLDESIKTNQPLYEKRLMVRVPSFAEELMAMG